MQGYRRSWRGACETLGALLGVGVIAVAAGGCGLGDEEREARIAAAEQQAVADLEEAADSATASLAGLAGLTDTEGRQLRRHLNADQVATARAMGVPPLTDSIEAPPLAADGRLVRLEDSTDHWVLRDLTHSIPYVTPDTRAMLRDMGERFHARLDSLGVPRFRFEITSVLRTAAMQAELRQGNSNASRTTSSHEFATTVDVAYHTFSAPVDPTFLREMEVPDTLGLSPADRSELERRIAAAADDLLKAAAEEHAGTLRTILGRVLLEMQEEERVQPLMERAQPVYHMTVAARYPSGADPARSE